MRYRLFGDKVLVRLDRQTDITSGGLLLPEVARPPSVAGTVVAVGTGRVTSSGVKVRPSVSPGDRVLVYSYAGQRLSDSDLYIFSEADILGIL